MAKLIKNRQVVPDSWLLLKAGADGALPEVPASGDVIVPLKLWQAQKDALAQRFNRTGGRAGVWLEAKEGPETIAADLDKLPLVAADFPSIGRGESYSTARLLRERYGYKGEVRAIGAVMKDTLLGMHRCGFDSLLLRDGEDVEDALTVFGQMSEAYQADALDPQPLFRRRAAKAGA